VDGGSFNVTLNVFEASLIPSDIDDKELRRWDSFDYYIVAHVSSQKDRDATKQKTAPQHSLHPVWNQSLEFRSVGVGDCLRLEVKRNRLGSNELLCRTDDLSVRFLLTHLGAADAVGTATQLSSNTPFDAAENCVGSAALVPLELVGDRCSGTLLVSVSSDPAIPAFVVESTPLSAASRQVGVAAEVSPKVAAEPDVVVHGNFACAVLP